MRIRANQMVLDGELLADGTIGDYGCGLGDPFGGGSGGGILVNVNILAGSGSIRAKGGDTAFSKGFGGGGRVAVYSGDLSGFDTNKITVPGGGNGAGNGTVFILNGDLHTHATFTIPGRLSLFPSNDYTLLLAQPLTNNLLVSFNQPIATNSFSPDKFLIQGPLGAVDPTGLSLVDDRLYRIDFPPQTQNGPYHFTLLPTLLDAEGYQLDQNANGIPGEPDDAFSFTLILDSSGPRVTQHTPSGGVPLGLGAMEIEFNEAIDAATFNPADAVIVTPTGQTNAITAVHGITSNRFRITFPSLATAGAHSLRVGPNIQDLAGNLLDQDGDGTRSEPVDDLYQACFFVHEADGNVVAWYPFNGSAHDASGKGHGPDPV